MMRLFLPKFRALLTNSLTEFSEYRSEIFIWIISGALPILMMFAWVEISKDAEMALSEKDIIAYFLFVFLVQEVNAIWVAEDLDKQIRLGELSSQLLRPINPYWYHLSQNMSGILVRLLVILPLVAVTILLCGLSEVIQYDGVWLFLLSSGLSWMTYFNIHYGVGLLSFWSERSSSVEDVLRTSYIICGGILAPITLFPDYLAKIILITPFPYLVGFPVSIILDAPFVEGGFSVMQGLAIQLFWLVLAYLLRRGLWARGVKKYSATGS
jgi:ABC-2 type transport system permease protein